MSYHSVVEWRSESSHPGITYGIYLVHDTKLKSSMKDAEFPKGIIWEVHHSDYSFAEENTYT